jgi:hypothetical protein
MMPAKLMLRAVPMLADAIPQFLGFFDKLLPRHCLKIVVHGVSPEPS